MPVPLSLIFLGTSAGGGPTPSRGCSSTAINMNGVIWLVDCAEGTQRQMLHAKLKIGKVQKIFVTHLHMDHCMGIAPLMSTLMSSISNPVPQPDTKRLDIYGPPGLRELLRTILRITQASLSGKYAVHELLSADDVACHYESTTIHSNEIYGTDFRPSSDGTWKEITKDGEWVVNAGPVKHRVPCLGYVFQEASGAAPFDQLEHLAPLERNAEALARQGTRHPRSLLGQLLQFREPIVLPDGAVINPPPLSVPGRKLVILGDTCDPWAMKYLSMDASLLVHESTNAYIPLEVDPRGSGRKESEDSVEERAMQRGHSTPRMAGKFARDIGAKRLVLNHFGSKFASRRPNSEQSQSVGTDRQLEVVREIERQASIAWGNGTAIAAYDLFSIDVPAHELDAESNM
ncbi:beta-lactamase superfamily protein [Rhizoctonia solani AG-3 Rhs1AP]|uniref:Beta-lactamase superfamily protein n=1 Tax=Rhizoctonia solani AG-3 Rhs1AP TaxID=1086054 RepID=X8JPU3_9AGAM|nr:beta-lactamase superfamily protein [Rhizoctonia solani AG-3 Rhs1AP]